MESKDALSIVDNVRFDMYDPATARRISVLQITESIAYDNLSTPIKGGLHDSNLGVSAYDKFTTCTNCGQDSDNCPGHFGHIDLAAPVYNPFYVKIIHRLLNSKCFNCDKLKMRNKEKSYIFLKFILIKLGLLKEASTLQSLFYSSTVQTTIEIEYIVSEFIGIIFEDYEVEGVRKGSFETSHTGNTGAITNTTNDKVSKKKKKEDNKDPNEEIQKLKQSLAKAAKEANLGSIEGILKSIKRLGKRNELGDQNLNIQIQMKEAYNEFWKLLKASKCPSCDASNVRIKKQGCLNFFKVPLSKK